MDMSADVQSPTAKSSHKELRMTEEIVDFAAGRGVIQPREVIAEKSERLPRNEIPRSPTDLRICRAVVI